MLSINHKSFVVRRQSEISEMSKVKWKEEYKKKLSSITWFDSTGAWHIRVYPKFKVYTQSCIVHMHCCYCCCGLTMIAVHICGGNAEETLLILNENKTIFSFLFLSNFFLCEFGFKFEFCEFGSNWILVYKNVDGNSFATKPHSMNVRIKWQPFDNKFSSSLYGKIPKLKERRKTIALFVVSSNNFSIYKYRCFHHCIINLNDDIHGSTSKVFSFLLFFCFHKCVKCVAGNMCDGEPTSDGMEYERERKKKRNENVRDGEHCFYIFIHVFMALFISFRTY